MDVLVFRKNRKFHKTKWRKTMNFYKMIENAFQKIADSGKIEQKIEETIQKSVESIINDLLKSYSDFGKSLKEQLSEKIKIDLDKIDLPTYNKMIENYIRENVNSQMKEHAKKLIDDNLKEILSVEEKDWKLSEFIEEFKSQLEEYDGERYGSSMTCIVDTSEYGHGDMHHIYIDEDENVEKYRCKIRLFVSDDKLTSVTYDGDDWNKEKFLGWKHGIEAILFRIYSQGKKFVVDEDDVYTEFGD